jgi:hypothetical protein
LTLFARKLAKHLAPAFRRFITSDLGDRARTIVVNGEKLVAIDPLLWKESERYDDARITAHL